MKPSLTRKEINEIRDFVCEGLLTDGVHHKQWYLEQVLNIIIEGGIDEAMNSVESQGYVIKRGIKP